MQKKPVTVKMVWIFLSLLLMSMLTSITLPAVEAKPHSVTVDGDPSDWLGIPPATVNTGVYSEFEYIWTDEAGDDTGNGTYTYPTAVHWATGQPCYTDGAADLVELRITRDSSYVYFLLTFDNITDNGWLDAAGWLSDPDQAETTAVAVCIDTDLVYGSGMDIVDDDPAGDGDIRADILLPEEAYWEYLIEIALMDVVLWRYDSLIGTVVETTRNFPCAADTVVYETIEFAVPIDPYWGLDGLPDPADQIWRFSVFIGLQEFEYFMEVASAEVAAVNEWAPGGGEGDWGPGATGPDPDVFDAAFFATRVDQEDAFNAFGAGPEDYAVISACMDIDMNFMGPAPPPPLRATINIDPDTLNLWSKGQWITCYIELPES